MDANSLTGVAIMNKCTFCHERVSSGGVPACAEACTTGAISFGKRAELIAAAEERIKELSPSYPAISLYGLKELGGLHVMYILDASPETYGLPSDPVVPSANMVRKALSWIGSIGAIVAVAGFGLNYLIARKRMAGGEQE